MLGRSRAVRLCGPVRSANAGISSARQARNLSAENLRFLRKDYPLRVSRGGLSRGKKRRRWTIG